MYEKWGLDLLLNRYQGLAISAEPQDGGGLIISGPLTFSASYRDGQLIEDTYRVRIEVGEDFPISVPKVREIGGRIDHTFHMFPDGTICMGAPVQLRLKLDRYPTLLGFVEQCVIPYLYSHSHFQQHGTMPYGEREHGVPGILQAYMSLFRTDDRQACLDYLWLAGTQRRKANRHACPCGSGKRLGQCHHGLLNRLRRVVGRLQFRQDHQQLRRAIHGA